MLKVFICLLLAAAVICTDSREVRTGNCSINNPFIRRLSSKGVQLLRNPSNTNTTCAFEFASFGTCCKEQDLLEYAETTTKGLMADVKFINQEYLRFEGVIQKAYSLLHKMAGISVEGKSDQLKRVVEKAQNRLESKHFKRYFKNHLNSTQDGEHFVRENTKCWEMQAKARNVALCYTCSGRSSHFFKDNKALINQETCDAFVRDCGYSLAALVKFIKSFKVLLSIARKLQRIRIHLNFRQKLEFEKLNGYFKAFTAQKVGQIVKTAMNLHNPERKVSMCSKFLRLGGIPIIRQMRRIFKSDKAWEFLSSQNQTHHDQNNQTNATNVTERDESLRNREQFKEGQNAPRSNWRLSRLLQFTSQKEELLDSDSEIMDVTDPSYSSLGVSGNSPMEFNHQFP